jgi:DNA ligase 1
VQSDSENLAKPQFSAFAELCEHLSRTASRLERTRLVADYLRGLDPAAVEIAARLLLGRAFPEQQGRRLSLGGSAVWAAVERAGGKRSESGWAGATDFGEVVQRALSAGSTEQPESTDGGPTRGAPLSLADVHAAFVAIAAAGGAGSRRRRVELLADLFRRAAPVEAKYLAKIVVGEMRHGVQEGIVLDAIAALGELTPAAVRRAQQALGDIGRLAAVVKADPTRLDGIAVRLLQPIKPMLAQTATTVADAFAALGGRLALEWKLDGARVQIHKQGAQVRIFSRRLQDITRSLPDVVEHVVRAGAAETVVFEGEVIAIADGRPLPFQELMRRFRRIRDVAAAARATPVALYLFDLLYLDDRPLIDQAAAQRWTALEAARGALARVPQLLPDSAPAAQAFYRDALTAGHEGVMAKSLDAAYTPGVRGAAWLKVKHSVTLDLVIVAADWGYGRRHRWLSNYHLAARDPSTGAFEPVGKTFKGPTDAEFQSLTERLLRLRIGEQSGTVSVRPELVVEVRFDGIQTSSLYPSGMALRFARIVRMRDDKRADEADTVATLRRLLDDRPA